jgi:hypothetical protein
VKKSQEHSFLLILEQRDLRLGPVVAAVRIPNSYFDGIRPALMKTFQCQVAIGLYRVQLATVTTFDVSRLKTIGGSEMGICENQSIVGEATEERRDRQSEKNIER